MARESSVAPKERINVTFKPATGGAVEEIELPMKVMVVGDFLQRYDDRHLRDRKPVNVNKNNFNDVMSKQNLTIETSVPDMLKEDAVGSEIQINISIDSMRDFEPGSIVGQIPEMQKMQKLRDALVSLKGPLGNLPTFRKALEDVLQDPRRREQVLKEVAEAGVDLDVGKTAHKGKGKSEENIGQASSPEK